jgi:outer membrane protein
MFVLDGRPIGHSRWTVNTMTRASWLAICVALFASTGSVAVRAETISGALAKAYGFSPDLGQQRAATRAADEGVPKATGGFRPTVTATGTAGVAETQTRSPLSKTNPATDFNTYPRTANVTITQTIYNGNRTENTVRQAESTVLQSRETLRLSELNILNNAAAAYMNVLRDTALLQLNESNIQVLQQQLKQTNDRFQVGEVTRTDVAQAQAALASGQATAFTARSNLQNSLGIYRQLIGEPPKNLAPARAIEALLPKSLVAALNVKVQEGTLYPTLSVQGVASRSLDAANTPKANVTSLSAIGNLTVPIYDGGVSYANIRQSKEQLGQARLQADLQREAVRSLVVSAWGAYQNTKASIQSFLASVRANEVALAGIREEAKVGQRTTLDVLNAQQTLLNSRTSLVTAQRDQVVNSYALSAAVGQLSATKLGLGVVSYDPTVHFDQVKDKIFGVRTPDGR